MQTPPLSLHPRDLNDLNELHATAVIIASDQKLQEIIDRPLKKPDTLPEPSIETMVAIHGEQVRDELTRTAESVRKNMIAVQYQFKGLAQKELNLRASGKARQVPLLEWQTMFKNVRGELIRQRLT
jgi:hypothetical protein